MRECASFGDHCLLQNRGAVFREPSLSFRRHLSFLKDPLNCEGILIFLKLDFFEISGGLTFVKFFRLLKRGGLGAHISGFGLIRLSQNPSFFRQLCIPLNQPREGIHLCIFSRLENYVSYLALVVDF